MIPQTIDSWQGFTWKEELRDAVSDVRQLLDMLDLRASDIAGGVTLASEFPLRVPASFIRRMEPGNPNDPLLLQVLPLAREAEPFPGFTGDPLRETEHNPVPGVVHKYHGRVLLIATPTCAVNCRYCFRRHFPYDDNNPGRRYWRESLAYIGADATISEVILSGGDPLASNDRHLSWLVEQIEKIPHVRRLRIHTRLPVVIPRRIDDDFLAWVDRTRLQTSVVLHINHPNEIDAELDLAVQRLRPLGIPALNQTVLLKDINDDADTLIQLSEKLFSIGVLPYYLHLLDPVAGAHHFRTADGHIGAVYSEMRRRLPGYLLPRLVKDVPGRSSKMYIDTQNS